MSEGIPACTCVNCGEQTVCVDTPFCKSKGERCLLFTLLELAAMKERIEREAEAKGRREALEEVHQWIEDAEGDIDFVIWSMRAAEG